MLGAIVGNVVGTGAVGKLAGDRSAIEEGRGLTPGGWLAIEVANGVLNAGRKAEELDIASAVHAAFQDGLERYPQVPFGEDFRRWVDTYGFEQSTSEGTESAQAVCALGWVFSSVQRTRQTVSLTLHPPYPNPDALSGAEAIASTMCLLRAETSISEIKSYLRDQFHYDFCRSVRELRGAQDASAGARWMVPAAITSALEANSFQGAIYNALSLGVDAPALATITGAIAEVIFPVPHRMCKEAYLVLNTEATTTIYWLRELIAKGYDARFYEPTESLMGNVLLENAIEDDTYEQSTRSLLRVMETLARRMDEDGALLLAYPASCSPMYLDSCTHVAFMDPAEEDARNPICTVDTRLHSWLALYTDEEEVANEARGKHRLKQEIQIRRALLLALNMEGIAGVEINPGGPTARLSNGLIAYLLDMYDRGIAVRTDAIGGYCS